MALIAAGIWYWQERGDRLDQARVRQLLAGNTVAGAWGDESRAYRQYFDPDGTTVYLRRDAGPAEGLWRVEADGLLCIDLDDAEESCLYLHKRGEAWQWMVPWTNRIAPFQVLQAKQLAF